MAIRACFIVLYPHPLVKLINHGRNYFFTEGQNFYMLTHIANYTTVTQHIPQMPISPYTYVLLTENRLIANPSELLTAGPMAVLLNLL